METGRSSQPRLLHVGAFLKEERGSILIEAAFAVPLLVMLLTGILAYGSVFMLAHNLQQAANDAARSAVAGLNANERRALVDQSVNAARASFPAPRADTIDVGVQENGGYYRVTLSYNLANAPVVASVPIPMAKSTIQRSAVVRIHTL